jgi:hypothetical protein
LTATAVEEALDRGPDDGTQRTPSRFVALVVDREVSLEVLLEDLVEVRALGVTGPIDGRGCRGRHVDQPVSRGLLAPV